MINPALTRVVTPLYHDSGNVEEFGFIPALIAIAAAVAPSLMGGSKTEKDAKSQKKAMILQAAQEKREAEKERAKKAGLNKGLLVGGGVALVAIAGIAIYVATHKKRKKR